jgi:hypothetical protein
MTAFVDSLADLLVDQLDKHVYTPIYMPMAREPSVLIARADYFLIRNDIK